MQERHVKKEMIAFSRVVFRPYQPDIGAGKDYSQNECKRKFQKRKRQRQGRSSSPIRTFCGNPSVFHEFVMCAERVCLLFLFSSSS